MAFRDSVSPLLVTLVTLASVFAPKGRLPTVGNDRHATSRPCSRRYPKVTLQVHLGLSHLRGALASAVNVVMPLT